MKPLQLFALALLATSGPILAADSSSNLAVAQALASSAVRVQYQIQSDKGDQPEGGGLMERCPDCGRAHINRATELLEEERPLEIGGFVLEPNKILVPDAQIHPRFIKSVTVRFGSQAVEAVPCAFALQRGATLLELKGPLSGVKPLAFSAAAAAPYLLATYQPSDGDWTLTVRSASANVITREKDQPFSALSAGGLITDAAGAPVGMALDGELPLDNSWKGSPQAWQWTSSSEISRQLAQMEDAAKAALLRVELNFRSPSKAESRRNRYGMDEDSRDEKATDRNAIGVLLPDSQLLVLAALKPKTTARLQTIRVYPAEGETVSASFVASLKDFGCFVAKLEKPLPGAVKLSGKDILEYRRQSLLLAEAAMRGEKRVAYFEPGRIQSFTTGPKQKIYPRLRDGMPEAFLFETSGALVALPLPKREKPSTERHYESEQNLQLIPGSLLSQALADLAQSADPANIPLAETEENRLAWMGVELQALTKELARANNVSDETRDGETGGLVTYVYPDSPAAKAGIEAGFILLRLHAANQPNPIEVKLEEERAYGDNFPWDRLSEVPEQYFDRIPCPWPQVDNAFNRLLTDLSIGASYRADFYANGKVVTKDFTVAKSPPYYESAAKFKSDSLGLTVRDLTYELRRYLQKKNDEPGVVISKIERGSKASIAGVKPYELITHVNDQPVSSVEDFKKLTVASGELRLSIKRMAAGRIVTIKPAAPAADKKP